MTAVALVGGRQLMLDEPDPAAGPGADPAVAQTGPRAVPPVAEAATGSDRTPAGARAALERLLASRAVITTRLLQATMLDDRAMAAAAETLLATTTAGVGEVTREWQGQSVADELTAVLGAQSTAAVAYTRALREEDDAAAALSLDELSRSSAELGAWLDRTTGGDVKALYPREDGGMLRAYAEAELRGDRERAGDYAQALQLRMSREGGTLATSVAGPAPIASFEERQLVERWQLLFSRHAVLAGDVVRAAATSAESADEASAALATNTRDITALVAGALPPDQGRAFADLWGRHADAVVDLLNATAATDTRDRSAAATHLTDTAQALSAFFREATGGRLTEAVAGAPLQQHATSLVQQGDAWSSSESAVQAYTLVIADQAAFARLGAHIGTALGAEDPDR